MRWDGKCSGELAGYKIGESYDFAASQDGRVLRGEFLGWVLLILPEDEEETLERFTSVEEMDRRAASYPDADELEGLLRYLEFRWRVPADPEYVERMVRDLAREMRYGLQVGFEAVANDGNFIGSNSGYPNEPPYDRVEECCAQAVERALRGCCATVDVLGEPIGEG